MKREIIDNRPFIGEEERELAHSCNAEAGVFKRRMLSGMGEMSCPELEIRAAAGDVIAQQKLALQKATGQCF